MQKFKCTPSFFVYMPILFHLIQFLQVCIYQLFVWETSLLFFCYVLYFLSVLFWIPCHFYIFWNIYLCNHCLYTFQVFCQFVHNLQRLLKHENWVKKNTYREALVLIKIFLSLNYRAKSRDSSWGFGITIVLLLWRWKLTYVLLSELLFLRKKQWTGWKFFQGKHKLL